MYRILNCDDPETDKIIFSTHSREKAETMFKRLQSAYDSLLLKSPEGRILKTHPVLKLTPEEWAIVEETPVLKLTPEEWAILANTFSVVKSMSKLFSPDRTIELTLDSIKDRLEPFVSDEE